MENTTALYHPLDGTELLKWVLLDAGQKLAQSSEFSKAMAYHNPKYTLHIKVECYDSLGKVVNHETNYRVDGQKLEAQLPDGSHKVILDPQKVENGPIMEPDSVRDQIKEGRYATKKVGGVLCDVKEEKKDEKATESAK